MITLQRANAKILTMLRVKGREPDRDYRLTHFLLRRDVEEGVLFFNTLTCELLLLTKEEAEKATASDVLIQKGFVVPTDFNEHGRASSIRSLLQKMDPPTGEITSYTVYTTLECNARCYYCYEQGHRHCTMSEETAKRAAKYMAEHCGGKNIKIGWFGGEPLCNTAAMDTICRELEARGVEFNSGMISNSYLFDDAAAEKAAELWRIKHIQVTLDGTEEVYNRTKAYVSTRHASPFRAVLDNIDRMLDKGIRVSVRLNVSEENAGDLLRLVVLLKERFGDRKGFSVYSHMIFEYDDAEKEVRDRVVELNEKLRERLRELGLNYQDSVGSLPRSMRLHHCMVDNGRARTLTPEGLFGLCEHYFDSDFVGSLDNDQWDKSVIAAFAERIDDLPACESCPLYPQCILIKKCVQNRCFENDARYETEKLISAMGAAYQRYLRRREEKLREAAEAAEETNGSEESCS